MSGELATERWSPLQCAESVLRSVLLLLDDPEVSSAANVDASVLYRNDREAYIKRAKEDVKASKGDIPAGFLMPTALIEAPPEKMVDDAAFWAESEAEDDFGGSDSSGEDAEMDEFDDDREEEHEEEEETEE
jgi:ubiquitin-conjugating enzyme E2 R